MASENDGNNLLALALLTPLILVCVAGMFFYAPVLYGTTTGALPTDDKANPALRFEEIDNSSVTADVTKSDLDDDTIERVDNAISKNELAQSGPNKQISEGTFQDGDIYLHGDEYYRVTYVEKSYPPVGYISSPDITLSFMAMAVFFSAFSLVTSAYYIVSILGRGNSWHYETKDLVFYALMTGDIMVAATAALLLF